MQQAFFPQPACLWVPYHHPQTESSLLSSSLTRCCSHKALPSFPPLAVPCLKALPSHFISSALSLPGELFNSSSFTVSHTCCLLAPVKRGKFPGCCCLLAALPNTTWGLRHVLRLTRRPVPAASRLCLAQATLSASQLLGAAPPYPRGASACPSAPTPGSRGARAVPHAFRQLWASCPVHLGTEHC